MPAKGLAILLQHYFFIIWPEFMNLRKRLSLMFAVFAVSLLVDQLSKVIAKATLSMDTVREYFGGSLKLVLTHNDGAFLSLGEALPTALRHTLLLIGVGIFLLGLVIYTALNKRADTGTIIALSMVFSGGLSNLLDRIIYGGYVVDFLNLSLGSWHTGVFNVADIAIMAGAVMLLLVGFKGKSRIALG